MTYPLTTRYSYTVKEKNMNSDQIPEEEIYTNFDLQRDLAQLKKEIEESIIVSINTYNHQK